MTSHNPSPRRKSLRAPQKAPRPDGFVVVNGTCLNDVLQAAVTRVNVICDTFASIMPPSEVNIPHNTGFHVNGPIVFFFLRRQTFCTNKNVTTANEIFSKSTMNCCTLNTKKNFLLVFHLVKIFATLYRNKKRK